MSSLPPIPPPVNSHENIVAAKVGGRSSKTLLIAIIVAFVFGGGSFAGTYFFMNSQLEEVNKEKLTLDQRLTSTEAELITIKANLEKDNSDEEDVEVEISGFGENLVSVADSGEGKFIIKKNGIEIGNITSEVEGMSTLDIFRVTASSAYFEQQVSGIGGYIPYEIGGLGFYRLDLKTNKIARIDLPEEAVVFDLSPGESQILYRLRDGKNVILRDLITGQETKFSTPSEFSAFGDAIFSPDGTRFAYAAAKVDMENEESAAYIVNIATQQQQEIKRVEGSFVNVKYWGSNDYVAVQ